jgi:hypothetical protein
MVRSEILPAGRRSLGHLRALACVLAATSLTACATAGHSDPAPSPVANRVVVHNYNWDRLTVYIAGRGTSWRLGAIDGLDEATFRVPRAALASVEDVHLVARPIAGASFRSESFVFPGGTTAVWTVQNQTALSHVILR